VGTHALLEGGAGVGHQLGVGQGLLRGIAGLPMGLHLPAAVFPEAQVPRRQGLHPLHQGGGGRHAALLQEAG
jgi:hypothetical protein